MAAPIKTIFIAVPLVALLWLGATLLSCALAFGINAGELDINPELRSDSHRRNLVQAPLQRAADLAIRCFLPVPLISAAILLWSGRLARWKWANIVIRFALLAIASAFICHVLCFAAIFGDHTRVQDWLFTTANPPHPNQLR